jgi:Leucine-rich repeat (LRR) protein
VPQFCALRLFLGKEICFLTNLEILYLSNNIIDNISSNIQDLSKLEEFYIDNNNLTYITNNIILCRNLLIFIYTNNCIEYNSPQIIRFLNKIDKISVYKFLYNIFNNDEYDIDLINKVMTITNKQIKINKKHLINEIIKDCILKTNCKLLLIKYSNSYEYHPVLLIRFIELLYYIWINITKKDKIRINKQLKEDLPLELQFKALL